MIYILSIFAITAVGGLILAASVLRSKLAPWALSLVHAALGAMGLVLLVSSILNGQGNTPIIVALILLVVAALGGFYLANLHRLKTIAPAKIVVAHAGLAVSGVALLVLSSVGLI